MLLKMARMSGWWTGTARMIQRYLLLTGSTRPSQHFSHKSPESQNWPSSWKALVTFQMYILNFSVYIASSIYVPGEASIMQDFGVSEPVATLGLFLYTV